MSFYVGLNPNLPGNTISLRVKVSNVLLKEKGEKFFLYCFHSQIEVFVWLAQMLIFL